MNIFLKWAAIVLSVLTMVGMSSCKNKNPDLPPPGEPELLSMVMEQAIADKVFYDKGNANTAANYYFGLSMGQIELYTNDKGESTWIPSNTEAAIIYFDLYATAQKHEGTVMIPAGEYVVENSSAAGKANAEFTYGLWHMVDGNIGYASSVGGKVTVTRTAGDNYLIVAKLDMVSDGDGKSLGVVTVTYEGKIPFVDPAPGEEAYPRITEPINTTFTGVDAHYLGVAAYTSPVDTYFFDFFDDPTPSADGSLDEGNVFRLEIYTPHQGYLIAQFDPVVEIPDGTYNMVDGYVPVEAGTGTGNLWDSGYGLFAYGSYVRHLNPENESVMYGFLNAGGGSVKVAKTNPSDKKDKKYSFTVDAVTREGVSVKGTYSGEVNIVNQSQEMEPAVQSKLTEDKVLNLANVSTATVDSYGTLRNEQTNFYTIAVTDPVSRQSFQLWILAPPNGLIAGTYKVSNQTSDLKRTPFTYIIGDIQLVSGGADMVGTWGYHESNQAGKSIMFAPASKGDIIISVVSGSGADTKYKIQYVLTDDNPTTPHTMTAEFNGKFSITDRTASGAPKSSYKSIAGQTFSLPMLIDAAPKGAPLTGKGWPATATDKQKVAL